MSTATKNRTPARAPAGDGLPSLIGYLTRVLKTPTIGVFWEELAVQARDENWSHEEYLAAVLQRQVADRESKGTTMRIHTAHFPQVKTLEDFNLDHLPYDWDAANGARISLYPCNGTDAQLWRPRLAVVCRLRNVSAPRGRRPVRPAPTEHGVRPERTSRRRYGTWCR